MTALLNVASDDFFRIIKVITPEETIGVDELLVEPEEPSTRKGPIPMPLDNVVSSENPKGFWADFNLM